MTAHDRVESVLMIAWTERSRSSGIGAHDAVEYASRPLLRELRDPKWATRAAVGTMSQRPNLQEALAIAQNWSLDARPRAYNPIKSRRMSG